MLGRLVTWPVRKAGAWVGANPLRVAGATAAALSAGYLYALVRGLRRPVDDPLTGVELAVRVGETRPAYVLLVAAGLAAFLFFRG